MVFLASFSVLVPVGGVLSAASVREDCWLLAACCWESGGWMAVAPAATAAYFGLDNHSRNYGLVFTAYGFGAILGILASGVLRDMLGSYRYAFYPLAAAGIVSILLAACVPTRNC